MRYTIKNVGWAIGAYCNAMCVQCYSRDVRKNGDLLTKEDIVTVLDKLQKLGIKTLNLGGNEPIFTHSLQVEDSILPYLVREAKKRGLTLGITTNGTTMLSMHRQYYEEFCMVDDWDISLDSPFEAEHDHNRGIGFFDLAVKALELAQKQHISCSIVYCLMNWNCTQEHARALVNLTKRFCVDLRINSLKPTRRELLGMEASPADINRFFRELSQYYNIAHNSDIAMAFFQEDNLTNCPCGKYSFAISPKKDHVIRITPCVYLQNYGIGNLLRDDLSYLLEQEIFCLFRNNEPRQCSRCTSAQECTGGCLAYVLLTAQYGQCDRRCPVIHQLVDDLNPKPLKVTQKQHVHEDYLCTWIGEHK